MLSLHSVTVTAHCRAGTLRSVPAVALRFVSEAGGEGAVSLYHQGTPAAPTCPALPGLGVWFCSPG